MRTRTGTLHSSTDGIRRPAPRKERGLGLVELMVGVLVGLITTVVIFQVVLTAEQSKRITTAGSDVQAAGSMGLYFLERDLQQAGLGVGRASPGAANCIVRGTVGGAAVDFRMRPAEITDVAGGSDALDVLVGSSPIAVAGVGYVGSGAGGSLTLSSRAGYQPNDIFVGVPLGAPTTDCAASTVVSLPTDPLEIYKIVQGTSGSVTPPAGYDFGSGGELFNLGPAPRLIRYSIDTTKRGLFATNRLAPAAGAVEIGAGIIDLQAQYGYDVDNNNVITDVAGSSEWMATLPVGADWGRVLAVRIAILARSSEYVRPPTSAGPFVTAALPKWGGGSQDFHPAVDAEWQNYRYRVYETTVTLRNVLWGVGGS